MYSLRVSLVLACMVITGASRSVAVKLFYDLGFRNPLFVTILYLTGQGLSLGRVLGLSAVVAAARATAAALQKSLDRAPDAKRGPEPDARDGRRVPRRHGGRGEGACSRSKGRRENTRETSKRLADGSDHRVPSTRRR